jgi:hypothetical protein
MTRNDDLNDFPPLKGPAIVVGNVLVGDTSNARLANNRHIPSFTSRLSGHFLICEDNLTELLTNMSAVSTFHNWNSNIAKRMELRKAQGRSAVLLLKRCR